MVPARAVHSKPDGNERARERRVYRRNIGQLQTGLRSLGHIEPSYVRQRTDNKSTWAQLGKTMAGRVVDEEASADGAPQG